jgi:tripartite-type tricarboxylate transporter receptor subunit TctC
MIVAYPPGVGSDTLARILAEHMRGTLGQNIIVENITGAGGTTGTAHVARAAPDGYTLSVGNIGTHVISPATYPNIQYHPLMDFEPVALIATSAYWLIAKNALPPKDLTELITWLKANPDKALAAMVGTGGLDQIAGIYFQQKTGTRFQFVPYRGVAPAIQDLMAGHVDLKFDSVAASFPYVRSGQLKAYAVFGVAIIRRDPPRLILGKQFRRRSPPR